MLCCTVGGRQHPGQCATAGGGEVQGFGFVSLSEDLVSRSDDFRRLSDGPWWYECWVNPNSEIRTDGRNVETFDRLRHWAYATIGEFRCGPRETWNEVVDARALAIAAEVRAAHPQATHAYSDSEALDTAKSVAGWVWSRYVGGHLTRVRADTSARREDDRQRATAARRARGAITRDDYLAEAQRRRTAACTLRGLGVAVAEIARRLACTIRSVQRYLSELDPLVRCATSPSAPSDFEPRDRRESEGVLKDQEIGKPADRHSTVAVNVARQRPRGGLPLAKPMGRTG